LETDTDEAVSYEIESELHEDNVAKGDNNNVTGSHGNIWSKPGYPWNSSDTLPSNRSVKGLMT
jgi:hypothetical protein